MTTANKITIFRVILIPVFLVLMYLRFPGHTYWAFGVFVLASLSDFADGYIARHYNQVSDFGKFMDPLADKLLVVAAMLLFVLGRFIVNHVGFLRRCCIPAPVVGGLIFAIFHLVVHQTGLLTLTFDETLKNVFMIWFFTSVGYGASFKVLRRGAGPVLVFLLLATVMITMQNFVGVGFAQLFGLDDPRLGLCMGSIPLVGGHGTSGSFGPQFEAAGVAGAEVVAIACATYGLVSGSLMGGPIARAKIKKYGLHSSVKAEAVETVETVQEPSPAKDQGADSILKAFILLIIAAGIGTYINAYFDGKITLPTYMGAMIVALIIRNVSDWRKIELPMHAIDISGNVCLNIFLAIALMTLKLWELAALAVPMIVTLLVQTLIMFLFASFIVFRVMGRDYEAACMTTAFCGFGMGATPNAMANMLSVTGQYGPAPKAFFVVPIVGGMFVDFTNTAVLSVFLNFLPK